MKKTQAHGFRKAQIELEHCLTCKGKAVVQGVFHELVCIDCNGSGWVMAGSRMVLSTDELVTQLSLKLQQAQCEIAELKCPAKVIRPQRPQKQLNRFGAGGTNYTGD